MLQSMGSQRVGHDLATIKMDELNSGRVSTTPVLSHFLKDFLYMCINDAKNFTVSKFIL